MEVPLALETPRIKEEFNIRIKSDKSNYFDIYITNNTSHILIKALNKNDISKTEFENKYNIKELIKIKCIEGLDSIDEIFRQLKIDFKKDNIKLIEEINLLKIIIPIDLKSEKELMFELPKKMKSESEKFDILFNEVANLKKEIITLKEENTKLKEENKYLKNLFDKYIPFFEKYIQNNDDNNYLSKNSLIINNYIKKQNTII